jgi:hypothetical protein
MECTEYQVMECVIFQITHLPHPFAFRLVVLQIIIPNLSFLGNLCGILAGTCHLYGVWRSLLPSEALLLRLESLPLLRGLTSNPSFVSASSSTFSTLPLSAALRSGSAMVRSWVSAMPLPPAVLDRWRTTEVADDNDLDGLPEQGESDTTIPLV